MTDEELARFELVLREADRIRMQIASDEAAVRASGDSILQPPLAEGEQPFVPAVIAA
jgi:hypothetical protein